MCVMASTMRSRSEAAAAPARNVLDRRAHAVDGGVIQRAGFDAVRSRGILHAQPVGGQSIERAGPRIQHPDMRSVEFIARTQQKIRAERLHVDRKMRRVMHGVDHQQGAHLPSEAPRERNVVDRSQRIRRRADGKQLGARRDLGGHVGGVQFARFHQAHFAHHHAAFPEPKPRSAISFVIELSDEHLVALLQGAADGRAQLEAERRHALAEGDARAALPHRERRRRRCARSPCAGPLRGRAGNCRECSRCRTRRGPQWRRSRRSGPGCRPVRRGRRGRGSW